MYSYNHIKHGDAACVLYISSRRKCTRRPRTTALVAWSCQKRQMTLSICDVDQQSSLEAEARVSHSDSSKFARDRDRISGRLESRKCRRPTSKSICMRLPSVVVILPQNQVPNVSISYASCSMLNCQDPSKHD